MTRFLSNLSPSIIKWPDQAGKNIIEQNFREKGFPGIIGAIDGCHIKIDKPSNDPDSYINRKGFYSIQMHAVCDHRRKIIDLFVGYPDSGYPLQKYVLTPYRDRGNLNRYQNNFNVKLSQNRYVIEHCFGILKQKFRQLYHVKLRDIPLIVHFIRAACVLHNIALDDEFVVDIDPSSIPNNPALPATADNDDYDNDDDDDDAVGIRDRIAHLL
ncbi:unnamed protein product [Callosobruchus maculatus]|uniref:DDE Tnp4 domain-containing protein n=1 Tax=Callosobruchus maculatus TaxID=64391 RepID=A0A653DQ93_CALMS|nr:unnamed protein product [Callosobruchus maculatus]